MNVRKMTVLVAVALMLSVGAIGVSRADSIYVSNGGDGTIKIVTFDGAVSTFASGLDTPRGLAFDSVGNLYVACAGDLTIRKITPGRQMSTFASLADDPYGVAVVADNIYVAQNLYYAGAVLQFTPGGSMSTFAAGDFYPGGLVPDGNGGLFVANSLGDELGGVQRIDSFGNITDYTGSGLNDPIGLVRDASSGNLYAAEMLDSKRVVRIATDGSIHDFAAGVGTPYGLVVANGFVYEADFTGGAINKIDSSGNVTSFVTGLSSPRFMTVGPDLPAPSPLLGDFNNDGIVNDADYTVWADFFNRAPLANYQTGQGDNGGYNDADYTNWADHFGQTTPGIPEPLTLSFLALGGLAMLKKRWGLGR